MGMRAAFLVPVLLSLAAFAGTPAAAEEPPFPVVPGGVHRVSFEHGNPGRSARAVRFRVRLTEASLRDISRLRNPPGSRRWRTPWISRRERFEPGETRTLAFDFEVPGDAPPLLGAEVRIGGAERRRRFRGETTLDDGGAYRVRPAEGGGTPVPFRVFAHAQAPFGVPPGGFVARSDAAWASLRATLGLLSPEEWGTHPSTGEPAPWAWDFVGLPYFALHRSVHGPDMESETVLAVLGESVGMFETFWIRSVELRADGVLECRYSYTPCTPHYIGYILEPYCLGANECLYLAVPRTDAPVQFIRVPQ
jgi:hypothetical protein